jgi:cytochrome c oxidase accessory protein FixG
VQALPHWTGRHTRRRRLVQLSFLAVFALLPLFDLLRFDFGRARLHLFRREIWLDEWALLWLALMFAMWLVGAAALVLGRVYCAYACPQTVFSELAHDFDALGRRLTRGLDPRLRPRAARAASLLLVAAASVAASALFMAYFAPLPEVLARLLRFDVGPWVGAVGATATLLAFLDFAFVRETFCRTACPYGLLQGVIEDGRSLHVRFDATPGACISCGACARVCPMDIDIRQGAFQIECTRCGSCIDSCDAVLARMKPARPGLLAFDFAASSWRSWDLKRALVALATAGFGVALALAVVTREPLSLRLSPVDQDTRGATGALAESRFLLRAQNRGDADLALAVRADGLPAATLVAGLEDARVPAGEERRFTLVVRVPRAQVHASVTPFAWVVSAAGRTRRFPAALFVPGGRS